MTRLRIGLTGGIGSGKTVASDRFAELGAEVVDTDQLSRELVEPGQPALSEIVAAFGTDMLDGNDRLDRVTLRRRVFARPEARKQLEQILHPRIRDAMLRRAQDTDAPYLVFVIPLLIETGQQSLVDRVLVIDAPEWLQRTRAADRDGVDPVEIDRILEAQVDRKTRLRCADDVVSNDRGLANLIAQIDALHRRYLALAEDAHTGENVPKA